MIFALKHTVLHTQPTLTVSSCKGASSFGTDMVNLSFPESSSVCALSPFANWRGAMPIPTR